MMGTSGKSEEIIILSDDEDDKDTSCLIVEVEAVKKTGNVAFFKSSNIFDSFVWMPPTKSWSFSFQVVFYL